MEVIGKYDPNSLGATRPLDIVNGKLTFQLYGQDNELHPITVPDTRFNRQMAVWCRKFDRQ